VTGKPDHLTDEAGAVLTESIDDGDERAPPEPGSSRRGPPPNSVMPYDPTAALDWMKAKTHTWNERATNFPSSAD
jgi:hypothetical protein